MPTIEEINEILNKHYTSNNGAHTALECHDGFIYMNLVRRSHLYPRQVATFLIRTLKEIDFVCYDDGMVYSRSTIENSI